MLIVRLTILLVLLSTPPSQAAPESRPSIQPMPTLHFGVADHASEVIQTYVTFLGELYQELGYELHVTRLPGKRAILEADAGQLDGVILLPELILQSFTNLIPVPPPLAQIEVVAYSRPGTVLPSQLSDTPGHRIGFIRGHEATEKLTQGMNAQMVNDYAALFEMLVKGRIDLALALRRESYRFLNNQPQKVALQLDDSPVLQLPLFHFLNQRHAELAARVTPIMQHRLDQRQLQRLLAPEQPALPDGIQQVRRKE